MAFFSGDSVKKGNCSQDFQDMESVNQHTSFKAGETAEASPSRERLCGCQKWGAQMGGNRVAVLSPAQGPGLFPKATSCPQASKSSP